MVAMRVILKNTDEMQNSKDVSLSALILSADAIIIAICRSNTNYLKRQQGRDETASEKWLIHLICDFSCGLTKFTWFDRWVEETQLCVTKFFKFNDEPSAPGLSEEEVQKIRQQMQDLNSSEHPINCSKRYKQREALLEALAMKMKKEAAKELEETLKKMQETAVWTRPRSTFSLFFSHVS